VAALGELGHLEHSPFGKVAEFGAEEGFGRGAALVDRQV
jgi:hypothetical protein